MSDSLTQTPVWKALNEHYSKVKNVRLKDLFQEDSKRAERLSLEIGDIFIDYSKNRITEETISLLLELANSLNLKEKINEMFSGKKINTTENREVLHIALRNRSGSKILVGGMDIMPDINNVLFKMEEFSNKIRSGEWKGFSGKKIRNIINLGIGGSDLGPLMAYEALKPYSDLDLTVRFISNIDEAHFIENTRDLNPEETLFIIASKTFTTDETMTNAKTARDWVLNSLKDPLATSHHFVAVSTNADKVKEFGIDPENMFIFWDFVGGRYSLCSAIGLSLMIALGPGNFNQMLEGFYKMDTHFQSAALEHNAPVILALISIWYNNFFGTQTELVSPYNQYLRYFSEYLQQLVMESNGKSISNQGQKVDYQTAPVIWGKPGTDGQHSFYQLVHQGTRLIPIDFIGFIKPHEAIGEHHLKLVANMFAQSEALAFGRDEELNTPYKSMPGNRPSNTILMPELTPSVLGQLIALYEHKTFVEGVIWDIDSFDQWGVELGKVLAKKIMEELKQEDIILSHDSSTNQLISRFKKR